MTTPMAHVAGKAAFITGGSSGIGLGIARAFVDAGMNVGIGFRTQRHLDAAMYEFREARDRVHAIRVEVTDRAAMDRAAAEVTQVFGKVHVLVNNAGVSLEGPIREATHEDWDWLIGVNLTGVFNGVHAFLPHILSHAEGGQIITISSVLGLFSIPRLGIYSASKFAVIGLTEAMRAELAEANIGVSVCCPGVVATNIVDSRRNRPDVSTAPSSTLDTLEVGRRVLRGMRENALYILTHSGYEPVIGARHAAIVAETPTDNRLADGLAPMMQKSLDQSIYATALADTRLAAVARIQKPCSRE